MRKLFSLLALLSWVGVPAYGQGTGATLTASTAFYERARPHRSRPLPAVTRLVVNGCLRMGDAFYYVVQVDAAGAEGLVTPGAVHPDGPLQLACPAARGGPAATGSPEAAQVRYTAGDVALRAGPGSGFEVIALLPPGRALVVAYCAGGWCAVFEEGGTPTPLGAPLGYVAAGGLREEAPAGTRSYAKFIEASGRLYEREQGGRCYYVSASGRKQYVDAGRCR